MSDNRNGGGNMLTHLLLGFAAGVAAVVLTDEKKREKIKEAFGSAVKKGKEVRDDMKDKLEEGITTGRRKIARELEKTSRQMSK